MMERDNPLSVLLEKVVRSMPSSLLCKHISERESDESVHALLSCPDWRLQKTAYRLLLHKLMAIAAVPDEGNALTSCWRVRRCRCVVRARLGVLSLSCAL
jgi:hypothetical protein